MGIALEYKCTDCKDMVLLYTARIKHAIPDILFGTHVHECNIGKQVRVIVLLFLCRKFGFVMLNCLLRIDISTFSPNVDLFIDQNSVLTRKLIHYSFETSRYIYLGIATSSLQIWLLHSSCRVINDTMLYRSCTLTKFPMTSNMVLAITALLAPQLLANYLVFVKDNNTCITHLKTHIE